MRGITITMTTDKVFLFFLHVFYVATIDVKPQMERYKPTYNVYHNLSSIVSTLKEFIRHHSDMVRLVEPEKYVSKQGRNQFLMHIHNFSNENVYSFTKIKVLLSFGEHAREFLPLESLFYMLKMLLINRQNPNVDLNKVDLYVIALANPDGRYYVEQTENYCWRGTYSGVDINRNFDWEFGGKGSSGNPDDEEYRGSKAFSEPESFVFRDITEKVQFDGFLSFHSGIKQIYIPFADTKSRYTGRVPPNIEEMMTLAQMMATSTVYKYEYGKAANLNEYTADGTVFDYMAGNRKIPFCYAIELWGPDKHTGPSCFDLFNPPNDQLQTVISDIYPLYVKFFQYILDWKTRSINKTGSAEGKMEPYLPKSPKGAKPRQHYTRFPSVTPGIALLCLLVILTMIVGVHGKHSLCRRFYKRRRVISLRALSSTLSLNLFHV